MEERKIENNTVHLCDSCEHIYPECSALYDDVLFGDGFTGDNICCCNKYDPNLPNEMSFTLENDDYKEMKLYAIENLDTNEMILNANGGFYKYISSAIKKLEKCRRQNYDTEFSIITFELMGKYNEQY